MEQNYLISVGREAISNPTYSPDCATYDYTIRISTGYALAKQKHLSHLYETLKDWLEEWFFRKVKNTFCLDVYELAKDWKCVFSFEEYWDIFLGLFCMWKECIFGSKAADLSLYTW